MTDPLQTIDRYTVEAVLGEGGMGRVYRALDPRLGRRVAVKVLLAQGVNEEARRSAAARMVREARAAAAFNHPNVVAVYDVGEFEGNPFIAMELVIGTTMRDLLADPAVTGEQRLGWLLDVARGLGAAHRAGLVHRDVKPENVMITADGVAKILDFGVARSTEVEVVDPTAPTSGANLATLTARGVAVGTPQYMSPEQLYGEPVDGRSDQFSWAVTTWEALVGSLPWGPKAGAHLIAAILATPLPPLAEVARGVEPRVSHAVARALEKRREHRFPTMEDLVLAIQGETALPRPLGSAPRLPFGRLMPDETRVDSGRTFAHPTRPSNQMLPKHRAWPKVGVASAAGVAAVAALWLAFRANPGVQPVRAEVDAAPAPASRVPADVAPFFARATRDEREGRHDWACAEYQRAEAAFPSSPEALLKLTLCYRSNPSEGRAYFRRAWALRSALSPRDAAVLDAFEPLFQRDPADYAEAKHRFEAALERFPDDAPLHFYLSGAYRQDYLDVRRAVGEAERSLAIDPEQPYVLSILSDYHAYDGDFPAVFDTTARCLRVAPGTLDCLEEEEWLDGQEGECAKVETIARRMLSIEPGFDEAVHALANALFAQGGSLETVRQLLARAPGADAGGADPRTAEAELAVLAGDFTTAERVARSLVANARDSPRQGDHGVPMRMLVAIEREMGHDADAAKVAQAYLEGRDAWEPNPDFDDWAIHDEPTPTMLAALRAVGALTRSAYDAEIARTAARWLARVTPSTKNFVWIYAYANPVDTADDAAAALAAEASFLPIPRFKPLSLADEAIGRAYRFGGRTDDAIVALGRAARSCFPLDHPIEHTRAHFELGMAREAKGDLAGACDAYAVVAKRWGKAKPRSVTFGKAQARMEALKCK